MDIIDYIQLGYRIYALTSYKNIQGLKIVKDKNYSNLIFVI